MLSGQQEHQSEIVALNDLEGLLIDTEFPKRLALMEVAREFFGVELAMSDISWTLGMRRSEVVEGLNARFADTRLAAGVSLDPNIPIGEHLLRRRDEIVNPQFRKGIDLMPGGSVLLQAYADLNLDSLIVTSTEEEVARQMLDAARIPDEFDAMVFGNSPGLTRGKPFPDPFLRGAKLAQVEPERCWVLGDSDLDILAGHAAGMKTVYVPDRRILSPVPRAVELATHVAGDLFEVAEIVRAELATAR
ncbi:MAG: HAD family phosphatase [Deltaproteobacteria bacterium]|nr:HAD family phosphatase [Deltaproteobacteria bacterium]